MYITRTFENRLVYTATAQQSQSVSENKTVRNSVRLRFTPKNTHITHDTVQSHFERKVDSTFEHGNMATHVLMLSLLVLTMVAMHIAAVPIQPVDETTEMPVANVEESTAIQPEQQPEELVADGKTRSSRQIGIGVGVIGVGLGGYPAYPAYPAYPSMICQLTLNNFLECFN